MKFVREGEYFEARVMAAEMMGKPIRKRVINFFDDDDIGVLPLQPVLMC